jgi:hypothetical protein
MLLFVFFFLLDNVMVIDTRGNEMIETSMTKKERLRSSELSFLILCSLGLLRS